jgi:adenosylcobinamide kinase / adenosylcobinamide-phosphate guanylyltransferase
MMQAQRSLIFGGARSGKSAHAEQLAAASGKPVIYIATATVAEHADSEMHERIAQHQQRRQQDHPRWSTVQEPLALGAAITRHSTPDNLLLVDCLTVWLSNLLFSTQQDYPEIGRITPPARFVQERAALLEALRTLPGEIVLVSNEVGMGIVPMGAISRWFVDEAGRLNQAVAAQCERVYWVAAGLPLSLKGGA